MENTTSRDSILELSPLRKLSRMIFTMMAIEPVMVNLLAILLGLGILFLLNYPSLFPKIGKYHQYLTYAIYGLISLQTIRSATKSLFIPIIALLISGIGFLSISLNPHIPFFNMEFLKQLMLLGVIGVSAAIFVIK